MPQAWGLNRKSVLNLIFSLILEPFQLNLRLPQKEKLTDSLYSLNL
jgi:hypothetical protein